jgi:hypothetical protein
MEAILDLPSLSSELPDFGKYLGYLPIDTSRWDGEGLFSLRRTKRKSWIFASYLSEEFLVGFAIVDAGLVATAFAYIKNRRTGSFLEEKMIKPFGFSDNFSPDLYSVWNMSEGKKSWNFSGDKKMFHLDFKGEGFSIKANTENNLKGLSVLAPSKNRPFHYTYKNMNLPSEIEIHFEGISRKLKGAVSIDFSKGFPPREIYWNWASLIGVLPDGEKIAFNLIDRFNENLENAIWIKDQIYSLSEVTFQYKKPLSTYNTIIQSKVPGLNIVFSPEGRRFEDLDFIFYKSQFVQAFGTFEGELDFKGETMKIRGIGLLEEHSALW